jgi:hypothetical protein
MHDLFPRDWYWRRDDGRFFSSARAILVSETDPDLIDWIAAGSQPTRWPADDEGGQTDAALQEVLRPHALFISLAEARADLKRAIDAAAEAERLKYITPGAGQAMTYTRKVEEAKAVQAASDPRPVDFPLLAASIGIDGEDLQAVAATVLGMDAAWALIGAAIEGARLTAKRAVDDAESVEDARAVVPQWPQP